MLARRGWITTLPYLCRLQIFSTLVKHSYITGVVDKTKIMTARWVQYIDLHSQGPHSLEKKIELKKILPHNCKRNTIQPIELKWNFEYPKNLITDIEVALNVMKPDIVKVWWWFSA